MLSRALKVHVHAAKKMLYDFHHEQNSKKPGSIHAVYLVSGIKTVNPAAAINGGHVKDGEDSFMQSSPFVSSPPQEEKDPPTMKVITLVREEQLEAAKGGYDSISTIHLYSLGPSYLQVGEQAFGRATANEQQQNLQILSDCTRELMVNDLTEDPLATGKVYGVIQNSRVKRRPTVRPPILAVPSIIKSEPNARTKVLPKAAAPGSSSLRNVTNAEPSKLEPKAQEKSSITSSKPVTKPSKLTREQSDIFKSFGKTKAPALKKSESSAGVSVQVTDEDEPMRDASEDEQPEDLVIPSKPSGPIAQRKMEREEALRKMMEDDSDEDMEPKADTAPVDDEVASKAGDIPAEEEAVPVVAPAPGQRRRGRRKVMKRRTIKDEEGYLVTKEEPSWESFSEDEPTPVPAPVKAKSIPTTASSTTKGGKKGASASKPGQGNIMSFFGKKP
ncbi:MAG: hypothetical protein MMC33_009279 [Icmadophila ericetorum]|nr:hypothetical protein [Icmadophila ericetorum]